MNFYITKKSFLGGVELMEYLDIPRSIDEYGNQREVVALQLKNAEDAPRLVKGAIVELEPADSFLYLEQWVQMLSNSKIFEEELRKELSKKHILHGQDVKVIGKRIDSDDILVEIKNSDFRYAVVRLTWIQKVETDYLYPQTQLFKDWVEVYNNRIVADNDEYASENTRR